MRSGGKRKKKSHKAVFPDTVLPKNRKEIILQYVTGIDLPKKPIAFYSERAERTLRDAGMKYDQASYARTTEDFKQHRPPSVLRLTENPKLAPAIYEAWRLISLVESLEVIHGLVLKILRETTDAGSLVEGFENIPGLIDQENTIAIEIGALGERIEGHKSNQAAFEGSGRMRRYAEGRSKIERNRKDIKRNFLRLYRELKRANLKATRNKLIEDALTLYPQKYPNTDPDKKLAPGKSAAYEWTSRRRN
jgi:hypothetical protein